MEKLMGTSIFPYRYTLKWTIPLATSKSFATAFN